MATETMTVPKYSELVDVSERTVRNHLEKGEVLTAVVKRRRTAGGHWRLTVDRAQLQQETS